MSEENAFSRPSRLGDVLSRLIRSRGLVETSAVEPLNTVWKRVAGAEIGARSTVNKLRDGVLEIAVSNGAVLEQLRSYLHQTMLEKVQAALPESQIRIIRYVRRRLRSIESRSMVVLAAAGSRE